SEYAKNIVGELWGYPPSLELEREAALQKALVEMIGAGLVESAHDCSDGGLGVALAECCFAGDLGANVELNAELAPEHVLFGEDASRVVLSCDPGKVERIQQIAVKYGVAADRIGETTQPQFTVVLNG